jgi:hypothetical protein
MSDNMKINYGLIAYLPYPDKDRNIEILHFCGYENPIGQHEIDSLREELKNDKEFGSTSIADDLIIDYATGSVLEYYKRIIHTENEQ